MFDFGNDENTFYRTKDMAFRSNKLTKNCTDDDEIVIKSWRHHFSPECVVENQNVDLFIDLDTESKNQTLEVKTMRLSYFEEITKHSYESLLSDNYEIIINAHNIHITFKDEKFCNSLNEFNFLQILFDNSHYDSNTKNNWITIPLDYNCVYCKAEILLESVEIQEFSNIIEENGIQQTIRSDLQTTPGKFLKFRYNIQISKHRNTTDQDLPRTVILQLKIDQTLVHQTFIEMKSGIHEDFFKTPEIYCGIKYVRFNLKMVDDLELVSVQKTKIDKPIVITCENDPYSLITTENQQSEVFFNLQDPSLIKLNIDLASNSYPILKIYYINSIDQKVYLESVQDFEIGDKFQIYKR